jgi:hypothetical protein
MKAPVEPLDQSAPLAQRLAAGLCRKDPETGADCSWYHGLWQDLRLMSRAASPEHQPQYFLEAFRELGAHFPQPPVLTEESFVELLTCAGLQITHQSRIVSSDPRNGNIEGKAIPKNSTHACLVAHRPG